MNPSTRSRRRRIADAIVHHPRPIARARLMLFGLTLLMVGLSGASHTAAIWPTADDLINHCVYAAEEIAPPDASRSEAGQRLPIIWRIKNTGSCASWSGVKLVRRSDELASLMPYYLYRPPEPEEMASPNKPPNGVVRMTTYVTVPLQTGIYQTEWQLQTPNGQYFGPTMIRSVQAYPLGKQPPLPSANQARWTLSAFLRYSILVSYYMLPALIAVAFVLWRATDFMNKLFGLKPPTSSFRHVMAMMFGTSVDGVFVKQGKLDHDPADTAAEIIGGPARLTVSDYSAAVLERGGFSRIVGPGITFLLPHERVRGAVNLQTQHRIVPQKTLSKDGLPIQVDVEMSFRITPKDLPADVPPKTPRLGFINQLRRRMGLRVPSALLEASRPHRFSREAVRYAIFETPISPDHTSDWSNTFANGRAGDISNQLAELRYDEVNAPDDPDRHPLRDIVAKGLEAARNAGAPLGVEMIDMAMGVVELQKEYCEAISEQKKEYRDPLVEQMITNWRAEWNRRATVLDAQGDARRLQLLEEARAEAQANMIQALTEGFRIATGDKPDVSHEVIVLRFIDTLEALMQSGLGKDKDKSPDVSVLLP